MKSRICGVLLLALGLGILISAILPAGVLVVLFGLGAVAAGLLACRRC